MICKTVFSMVCSFLMLVSDMIGLHMVFACSKMGRVMAFNMETINSFCLLHLVEVSGFRMLSICFALVIVTFICCENVSFELRVIPRIFGCFVGNVCFFNLSDRVVLYSAGSGVKSVVVVLSVFIRRLLVAPFCYFAYHYMVLLCNAFIHHYLTITHFLQDPLSVHHIIYLGIFSATFICHPVFK